VPRVKRTPVATTDDWQQLELLVRSPEQRVYELIRPIVLFGCPPAARARETGAPQRTLYRQADAFARDGMASLFPPPRPAKHHALPEDLRRAIRALKAEHPPLNLREIATICDLRFGRSLSHHTVKRILAEAPVAPAATRRFPPYQPIADPVERRLAIIRLHSEGWNKQSIADYLQCSRVTVHETLKRWAAEGVAGLDDKSHARKDGPRKIDMAVMAHVRDLAQNPELGAFRLYAALTLLGIHVSVRTCGRLLARNRALYGPVARRPEPKVPKPMPFAAQRRHQIWSVDIRYRKNDTLAGRAYSIAILDNYSRALVASALSPRQDLTAFLIVLYAAIRQHGAPEVLVSDSGSVFRAKQAQAISRALGIDKREIARKQPWQNSVETMFAVQRRMADWDFARAVGWDALADEYARWTANYNAQEHFAHQHRPKARRSPAAVLGFVQGRHVAPEELQRIFYRTRFRRVADRLGYLRFRHWRVYGERGLAGEAVAVWLYDATLTIEFADEVLAQYRVTYRPDQRHLANVDEPRLFTTPHRSPQPYLWHLGDGEWHRVLRCPAYAPRRRRAELAVQPPLFA
jgi:putative transposase